MADDEKSRQTNDADEGWIEIETPGAPPPPRAGQDAADHDAPDLEPEQEVYTGKPAGTPPGRVSLWIGGIGLVLLALVYLFSDLRRFSTPWDDSVPTVYVLLIFPVFGVLGGVIGLLGKEFRHQRGGAVLGLLVSLGAGVVAAAIIATDSGDPPDRFDALNERLEYSGEDLAEWRREKLRQDP